jgi:radical SAM protein with 4Fe4S-binding SPASM domain
MKQSLVLQQLALAGLHRPGILTLAITGACNLKCCHCWVKAGEDASSPHVPLQSLLGIVDEFAVIGGEGIRITGGEPLCHPNWLDIVQCSCDLGFASVILQTNAMLLRVEHVRALHALDFPGLSIQISLDGVTPQSHDLVRGEGAFERARRGIEMLAREGLAGRIAIFFTEMRHNLSEVPDLLEFADTTGIGSFSSGSMVMCGRAAETSLVAPPRTDQYLALIERFDRDARFRELYAKLGTVAALEWHKGESVRHDCCTFVENPYLTPTGRLYPCLMCHADEYSVTGVFEKGLSAAFIEGLSLWSSLQRISHCRTDEIPECQNCPLKSFCAGGCMGRAWGSCGNLLAADDRCSARQAIHAHRVIPLS